MILMAPCIIDFIGANDYLGQWGEGALDTPGPLNGIERSECHLGSGSFSALSVHPPPPTQF